MQTTTTNSNESTGYRPCACRDCFETAIGPAGALCGACREAGCEACNCLDPNARTCDHGECKAPGAYGEDDEEPLTIRSVGTVDPASGETCDLCEQADDVGVYTFDGLDGYFNACARHMRQRANDLRK